MDKISTTRQNAFIYDSFNHFALKTHLQAVRHQDLAGLLDHRLWLELLFAEGVPHVVEVLLARGVGHGVRSIHVKQADRIGPAAGGRQQRWTGGPGGGAG